MRTLRLGRTFDAVFVHDAVDYMLTEDDLRQAIETAFVHCRPGGRAVFMPDAVTETYEGETDHGGVDGTDGRAARYLSWSAEPGPDGCSVTEYAFLLRERDGSVRSIHETHRCGLFPRGTWRRLLTDAGFEAEIVLEVTAEDRTLREIFVGDRPAEGGPHREA
jgi:hypothetical protein